MILDIFAAKGLVRLALYCRRQDKNEEFQKLQELLEFPVCPEALDKCGGFLEEMENDPEQRERLERYRQAERLCGENLLSATALELLLARFFYPQIDGWLENSFPQGRLVTVENLLEIAGAPLDVEEDDLFLRDVYARMKRIFLPEESRLPYFRQSFSLDSRLAGYLCGSDALPAELEDCAEYFEAGEDIPPPLIIHEDCADLLRQGMEARRDGIFQLEGETGCDFRSIVTAACRSAGISMVFVNFSKFYQKAKAVPAMAEQLLREALLYGAGVSFEEIGNPDEEQLAFLTQNCVEFCSRLSVPLCFCGEGETFLIPRTDRYIKKIGIPPLTRKDRIALWKGWALMEKVAEQIDCEDAGSRFRLNEKEIPKAVRRLAEEGGITPSRISAVCGEVLPPPRQGNIKRIATSYTFDQLKLPPEQKQAIQNICNHVRYRHLVYDTWNMESRYAYGRNVSALLVGPPGTGKTMAVHVMANLLELPLYRIDLSQVVDKYIGETEKRLEEIFNTAEKSNVILFFDEADSIFGKRSEVNDAKDKYANTEVSYILQRIEQYDGIVILATNYKQNIDEAFMRRMRYLIEFQLPSESLRREIWESCFPPEVPAEGIDFAYLARQFELSGGSIKNVVLNAVFLAAGVGSSVTMKHILDSIRGENLKMGKTMLRQDFAEYGFLF